MAHTIGNLGSLWPVQKLVMLACCLPITLRWSAWKVAPFVALMGLVVANNLRLGHRVTRPRTETTWLEALKQLLDRIGVANDARREFAL